MEQQQDKDCFEMTAVTGSRYIFTKNQVCGADRADRHGRKVSAQNGPGTVSQPLSWTGHTFKVFLSFVASLEIFHSSTNFLLAGS